MTSVRFRLPEKMTLARIAEILCRGDRNATEALVVRILRDSAVADQVERLYAIRMPMVPAEAVEVTQGDVLICRHMYFDQYPEARIRQHHAGVDAEALRWGFESVMNGGIRVDRGG